MEGALDRLNAKWTANMDSSEDENDSSDSASGSLNRILRREAKTAYEIAPEFKLLPRDVTADAPSSIKVTCTVIASPEPEIVWTKNDTLELVSGDRYRIVHKDSVCMLEILRSHPSDSGTYSVTASNNLGSASCFVKLTVRGKVTRLAYAPFLLFLFLFRYGRLRIKDGCFLERILRSQF